MQNGIQSGLIVNGAVVKDAPGMNPVDLIYNTNANPGPIDPGIPKVYTPINRVAAADETTQPAANVVSVDAPAKNNTGIILAAAGLGALLLFSKDGKKAVQGIGGIGKGKKKSAMPLVLIGGAALAYYFYSKKDETSTTTTTPVINQPAVDPVITTTIQPQPVTPPIDNGIKPTTDNLLPWDITTQQAGYFDKYADILTVPDERERVLILSRHVAGLQKLDYLYRVLPEYSRVFATMTAGEVSDVYDYIYNYVVPGKGMQKNDNPGLFTRLQAAAKKYSLFFIA